MYSPRLGNREGVDVGAEDRHRRRPAADARDDSCTRDACREDLDAAQQLQLADDDGGREMLRAGAYYNRSTSSLDFRRN